MPGIVDGFLLLLDGGSDDAFLQRGLQRGAEPEEAEARVDDDLVEEDAKAFEPLSTAYGIPKDDPSREDAIQEATLHATYAPLDIMDACADTIDALDELVEKCNPLMLSDVGCGAILAGAALRAAAMNVYVNTTALKDRKKAEEFELTAERLLDDYLPLADVIAETVTSDIREAGEN